MVNVRKDLTGNVYERLTVIEQTEDYIAPNGNHYAKWLCKCSCGKYVTSRGDDLKSGRMKSCGCLHSETSVINGKKAKKYNQYDLTKEYGIGYTSKGEEFYFDLEDYDLIKDYCWYKDAREYIVTTINRNKKAITLRMHRLVMGEPDMFYDIDHVRGKDTRNDNRKENLRIATHGQNMMNRGLPSSNKSGAVGVYHNGSSWRARITVDKKQISLGLFKNFDDAVRARKEAEEKYFGEYSYDNSIAM
jgi:hypothetical protein